MRRDLPYDTKWVSMEFDVDTGDETFTQQHLREEVDINTIVRRFGITRGMPSGEAGGVYGDFTGIYDYESALAAVERAREGFMALSPDVREKFANDPAEYLSYHGSLSDEELEELNRPAVEPVAPGSNPSEGSGSAAT